MFKLLIPLIILVVICLLAGAPGLKLLAFSLLCFAAGILVFGLLYFVRRLILNSRLRKVNKEHKSQ